MIFKKLFKHLSYFSRRKKNPAAIDRLINIRLHRYINYVNEYEVEFRNIRMKNHQLIESLKTKKVLMVSRRYGDESGPGHDTYPIYEANFDISELRPEGEGVHFVEKYNRWQLFSYGTYEGIHPNRVICIIDPSFDPSLNDAKYFFYE